MSHAICSHAVRKDSSPRSEHAPCVDEDVSIDPSPEDCRWAAQAFADADFSHYPDECPELNEWAYYEPEEPQADASTDDHPHDSFLGGVG
jgi:hypothetical protein